MRHLRQFVRSLRNDWLGPAPVCLKTCLVLPRVKLIYAYVPKSACTSIKTWLLRYSGECPEIAEKFALAEQTGAKPPEAHDTMHDHFSLKHWSTGVIRRALQDPAYFKFTFVRHPLRRLVSAYLDKVVNAKRPAHELILRGQANAGCSPSTRRRWWQKPPIDAARSLTFREFVRALQAADPESLDIHFRAQHRLLRGLRFDFVGKLENLPQDFSAVQQRLQNTAPLVWRHITEYSAPAPECVADCPAARFRGVAAPPWQSFFDEELRADCCQLYADDFERFGYDFPFATRRAA